MISIDQLSRAKSTVKKALEVNPQIYHFSHEVYYIAGSQGNEYPCAQITNPLNGTESIECLCAAGLEAKPCYHAAALAIHLGLITPPVPCAECGLPSWKDNRCIMHHPATGLVPVQ